MSIPCRTRDVGHSQRASERWFPVTHSVCDCDALGRALAVTHRLASPITCKLLRRGFHDTYLLSARESRYVARVYRAERSGSAIAYELGLLVHLAGRGVSVSAPIPDVDDEVVRILDAPEGSRRVALFTYARGRALVWNRDESARAGSLLAAIHRESNDYVCRDARSALDVHQLIDAPLAALQPFLGVQSADFGELVRLADILRTALAARVGTLEWGACHGDFNGGNMHMAEDHSLTAFDFDFCGPGWRAYDFVGAWRWAAWSEPGVWQAFLEGYRAVKPIADTDLAAVPLLDGVSRLRSLGLVAANAHHRGTLPVVGRKLQRQLNFLRSWERDYLVTPDAPQGSAS